MNNTMTKTRILTIDDDPAMLDLMKFQLQEEGYEVAVAETSTAALELLGRQNFDLVLTDFQLPDLDGIELVKRSKALAPDTEIIMVTGYGSTAKMLGQAAVCLAFEVDRADTTGGFWTPATIFGDRLIQRLTAHSGLTFELVPDLPH